MTNDTELAYRVSNGVPNQLQMSLSPFQNDGRAGWHAGFVQEQWTRGQADAAGCAAFRPSPAAGSPSRRSDHRSTFPNQIVFPATKGVDSYNGLHAPMGLAYDVFGNGRTAREGQLRQVPRRRRRVHQLRELEPDAAHSHVDGCRSAYRASPARGPTPTATSFRIATSTTSATRTCAPRGGDSAVPVSNARWGQNVLTNQYDPNLLKGWGVRPSDWDSASRSSSSSCAGCRWRWRITAARSRLHGAGQHAGRPTPSGTPSVSPLRSTRRCRVAAATSCPDLYDVTPSQVRSDPQQRDRLGAVGETRRSSTASTSPSTCARAA